MRKLLVFSLLAGWAAGAALSSSHPAASHFAPVKSILDTPRYDLTPFGIRGGQLPRVYNINNGNMSFDAELSYQYFFNVTSGNHNVTLSDELPSIAPFDGSLELENSLNPRAPTPGCGAIDFTPRLAGSGAVSYKYYSQPCSETGTSSCYWWPIYTNSDYGWTFNQIVVTYAANAYVTFWTSIYCNGWHGSVNPACPQIGSKTCDAKQNFGSFKVYGGTCHGNDPSDGCN